jgi:hypothetical protein
MTHLSDLPPCVLARVAAATRDGDAVLALARALAPNARPAALLEDALALEGAWRDAWALGRVPDAAGAAGVARAYAAALAAATGATQTTSLKTDRPSFKAVATALEAVAGDTVALRVAARAVLADSLGAEPPIVRRAYRVRVEGWRFGCREGWGRRAGQALPHVGDRTRPRFSFPRAPPTPRRATAPWPAS